VTGVQTCALPISVKTSEARKKLKEDYQTSIAMLKEEFDLLYIQPRNLESRIVERETNQKKKIEWPAGRYGHYPITSI
jgi:hypothetical protein